jgi:hypothetical protein
VANQGNGGYNQGDGWLSWYRACCYGSSLGSNPDISKKDKMGDISKGVGANTLEPAKIICIKKKKKVIMVLRLPLLLFKSYWSKDNLLQSSISNYEMTVGMEPYI